MRSTSQERHLRTITKVFPHPGQRPQVDITSGLAHPAITSILVIWSDGLGCFAGQTKRYVPLVHALGAETLLEASSTYRIFDVQILIRTSVTPG